MIQNGGVCGARLPSYNGCPWCASGGVVGADRRGGDGDGVIGGRPGGVPAFLYAQGVQEGLRGGSPAGALVGTDRPGGVLVGADRGGGDGDGVLGGGPCGVPAFDTAQGVQEGLHGGNPAGALAFRTVMGMLWMILPCIVDGRALAMAPLVLTNLAPVVSLSSSMLKSLLPSLLRVSPSMLKSFLRAIFPCWNDAQISLRFCGVIAAGGAAAAFAAAAFGAAAAFAAAAFGADDAADDDEEEEEEGGSYIADAASADGGAGAGIDGAHGMGGCQGDGGDGAGVVGILISAGVDGARGADGGGGAGVADSLISAGVWGTIHGGVGGTFAGLGLAIIVTLRDEAGGGRLGGGIAELLMAQALHWIGSTHHRLAACACIEQKGYG